MRQEPRHETMESEPLVAPESSVNTPYFVNQGVDVFDSGVPSRVVSKIVLRFFWSWTAFWWLGVGVCAALFYTGTMDFPTSTKTALYGMSIWLNGWLLVLLLPKQGGKLQLYHDCLVVWMLTYLLTNLLWEIPWVVCSRLVFHDMHTEADIVAKTSFMRESISHMYLWILASFGSVDLRTVNHNSTFFTLELYSFVNVATTIYFLHLNKKRSPWRYLVPIIGAGEPAASTFIFSFSEVFNGFQNMAGGVADTLLALVWTQYQYLVFPLVFGALGTTLFLADWRHVRFDPGRSDGLDL